MTKMTADGMAPKMENDADSVTRHAPFPQMNE
jgi:hypothetical protein